MRMVPFAKKPYFPVCGGAHKKAASMGGFGGVVAALLEPAGGHLIQQALYQPYLALCVIPAIPRRVAVVVEIPGGVRVHLIQVGAHPLHQLERRLDNGVLEVGVMGVAAAAPRSTAAAYRLVLPVEHQQLAPDARIYLDDVRRADSSQACGVPAVPAAAAPYRSLCVDALERRGVVGEQAHHELVPGALHTEG